MADALHTPALAVLLVHAGLAMTLIISGGVLIAVGSIGQDTFLAMISGALGLVSGGGAAIALHNAFVSNTTPRRR